MFDVKAEKEEKNQDNKNEKKIFGLGHLAP
jgi:hypothetical protein